MSKDTDLTPAALYARVSSDRQDVDLPVVTSYQCPDATTTGDSTRPSTKSIPDGADHRLGQRIVT